MALENNFDTWIDKDGREWALWKSADIKWDHAEDEIEDELGSDWRVANCAEILSIIDTIPIELESRIWACESHTIETHAMAIDTRSKRTYASCIDNLRQILAIKK